MTTSAKCCLAFCFMHTLMFNTSQQNFNTIPPAKLSERNDKDIFLALPVTMVHSIKSYSMYMLQLVNLPNCQVLKIQ